MPAVYFARSFYALILFHLFLLLGGCSYQYAAQIIDKNLQRTSLSPIYTIEREHKWVIPSSANISIANFVSHQSKEQAFNNHNRPNSKVNWLNNRSHLLPRAQNTFTHQLYEHSVTRFSQVYLANGASPEQYFNAAKDNNSQILIMPTVLAVNDQLNTLTEINRRGISKQQQVGKDSLVLLFTIYDVYSKKLLDVTTVRVKSGLYSNAQEVVDVHIRRGVTTFLSSIHSIQTVSLP